MSGSRFDSIQITNETYTSLWEDPGKEEEHWKWSHSWENDARALARNMASYPTGESIKLAYSATLVISGVYPHVLSPAAIVDGHDALPDMRNPEVKKTEVIRERYKPYWICLDYAIPCRRFCVTQQGYFGLVPKEARPGDLICILLGADLPVVLRKDPSEDRYQYVGDCYVYGIMNGEGLERDDFQVREFVMN